MTGFPGGCAVYERRTAGQAVALHTPVESAVSCEQSAVAVTREGRVRSVPGSDVERAVAPEFLAELRAVYREDVEQLEEMLDRDLSEWK